MHENDLQNVYCLISFDSCFFLHQMKKKKHLKPTSRNYYVFVDSDHDCRTYINNLVCHSKPISRSLKKLFFPFLCTYMRRKPVKNILTFLFNYFGYAWTETAVSGFKYMICVREMFQWWKKYSKGTSTKYHLIAINKMLSVRIAQHMLLEYFSIFSRQSIKKTKIKKKWWQRN